MNKEVGEFQTFDFYFSFIIPFPVTSLFLEHAQKHARAAPAGRISCHADNYDENIYSTYFTFIPYI